MRQLGILLTLSIVAALGLAVYENPEVQRWLDEQRRRIADLLRSIGEDLDPASRRAAESFAFQDRSTSSQVEALRREAEAKRDAAPTVTGRDVNAQREGAVRRIPVQGSVSEAQKEERRLKGEEYLARRQERMRQLLEKRRDGERNEDEQDETPPTPTSFDAMVDDEGHLRALNKALPSPPEHEPATFGLKQKMKEAEEILSQPLLAGESSSHDARSRGWQTGSIVANPFGDEYELERSVTPRPPIPPKIALESPVTVQSGSTSIRDTDNISHNQNGSERPEELSYEEQLAIALSLSEVDGAAGPSATVRRQSEEQDEADLRAAIAASLEEMDEQQAAHAVANAGSRSPGRAAEYTGPMLVDLTSDSSDVIAPELRRRTQAKDDWEAIFGQPGIWANEGRGAAPDPPVSVPQDHAVTRAEEEEDLYRLTPELTRARLAGLEHPLSPSPQLELLPPMPYEPVYEFACSHLRGHPATVDTGFDSAGENNAEVQAAQAQVSHPANSPAYPPIEQALPATNRTHTPTAASMTSSFNFRSSSPSEAESENDSFASFSASPSRTVSHNPSQAPSEMSGSVEVIDVIDDSDVDMLSEEGDGIVTPDSWTEVGSQDGESSDGEHEGATRVRMAST